VTAGDVLVTAAAFHLAPRRHFAPAAALFSALPRAAMLLAAEASELARAAGAPLVALFWASFVTVASAAALTLALPHIPSGRAAPLVELQPSSELLSRRWLGDMRVFWVYVWAREPALAASHERSTLLQHGDTEEAPHDVPASVPADSTSGGVLALPAADHRAEHADPPSPYSTAGARGSSAAGASPQLSLELDGSALSATPVHGAASVRQYLRMLAAHPQLALLALWWAAMSGPVFAFVESYATNLFQEIDSASEWNGHAVAVSCAAMAAGAAVSTAAFPALQRRPAAFLTVSTGITAAALAALACVRTILPAYAVYVSVVALLQLQLCAVQAAAALALPSAEYGQLFAVLSLVTLVLQASAQVRLCSNLSVRVHDAHLLPSAHSQARTRHSLTAHMTGMQVGLQASGWATAQQYLAAALATAGMAAFVAAMGVHVTCRRRKSQLHSACG
jgi:Reduced folate carrier